MPSVGICVYEHTCLPELWFCNFLWVEAPRPVPTVPEFVWPLQLAVTFGRRSGHFCPGDLELCTYQYWAVVPATASTSSPALSITTALPEALFILTLPAPVRLSARSMVLESVAAQVGSVSAILLRRIQVLFLKI